MWCSFVYSVFTCVAVVCDGTGDGGDMGGVCVCSSHTRPSSISRIYGSSDPTLPTLGARGSSQLVRMYLWCLEEHQLLVLQSATARASAAWSTSARKGVSLSQEWGRGKCPSLQGPTGTTSLRSLL